MYIYIYIYLLSLHPFLITNNRPNAGFTLRDHKGNETAGEQLDVTNKVEDNEQPT
jgi:hypothetical protein